jgi:hypothetical protein
LSTGVAKIRGKHLTLPQVVEPAGGFSQTFQWGGRDLNPHGVAPSGF